jgi:hypothetical protein
MLSFGALTVNTAAKAPGVIAAVVAMVLAQKIPTVPAGIVPRATFLTTGPASGVTSATTSALIVLLLKTLMKVSSAATADAQI